MCQAKCWKFWGHLCLLCFLCVLTRAYLAVFPAIVSAHLREKEAVTLLWLFSSCIPVFFNLPSLSCVFFLDQYMPFKYQVVVSQLNSDCLWVFILLEDDVTLPQTWLRVVTHLVYQWCGQCPSECVRS